MYLYWPFPVTLLSVWDNGLMITFHLELIQLGFWYIGTLKLGYSGYRDPVLHTPRIAFLDIFYE